MHRATLLLLVFLAACGKPAPRHPNVLLVTIDTLRRDAVDRGMPALDAFLREATFFPRARTVAPLTLVAHASILTGLDPAQHGIHDNATEPLPARDSRSFPLLAEQFRDAGYATAAFVASAVLAAPTGIGSGFDLYDCPASEEECGGTGGYVPGEERVRAPIEWIRDAPRERPWFVWVHLFDPHAPYRPFPGDALRAPSRESDSLEARYAGEVRRADAALGELLRAVGADTVVVVASDHGESLLEHGELTHGALCYGVTVDAVVALRAPGFEHGARDEGLRSVSDIAPTLRRVCDLPPCESDGRDLGGAPHETLISESLLTCGVHGWAQVLSVTDGRFSMIEAGASAELFDRQSDLGEWSPLGAAAPAYEKLDRSLLRFHAATAGRGVDAGSELLLSVSAYGGLRRQSKGYLSRDENAKLPNPRDHMQDWAMLEGVPPIVRACRARRDPVPLREALRCLDEIGKRIPQSPRVDHYRAAVHAAIAYITGVPARYGAAAASEITAIEKGYVHAKAIDPAIEYCVAASDAAALRRLIDVLTRSGATLSRETVRALGEATSSLDVGHP